MTLEEKYEELLIFTKFAAGLKNHTDNYVKEVAQIGYKVLEEIGELE